LLPNIVAPKNNRSQKQPLPKTISPKTRLGAAAGGLLRAVCRGRFAEIVWSDYTLAQAPANNEWIDFLKRNIMISLQ
jgi:hypothetical protein